MFLPSFDMTLQEVVEECTHADPYRRIWAVTELTRKYGQDALALQQFTRLLATDQVLYVRVWAAYRARFLPKNARVFQAIVAALDDPERVVRQKAVDSLVKLGDPAAAQHLVAATLHPPKKESWLYFDALRELGDQAATELLNATFQEPDQEVRKDAARLLGQLGGPAAVSALHHPDQAVRWTVAYWLGRGGDQSAIGPLCAALQDPDPQVRKDTAEVLGQLGSREATEPLRAALSDKDQKVSIAVACALARLGELTSVLSSDIGSEARSQAIWTINKSWASSVPNLLPTLLTALQDTNSDVRAAAASRLGKLGNRATIAPLLGAIADPENSASETVASALIELTDRLGDLEKKAIFTFLSHFLHLFSPEIKEVALVTLGKFGREEPDPQEIKLLLEDLARQAARDGKGEIVAYWSGEMGGPLALVVLETLLQDNKPAVRRECLQTLQKQGYQGVKLLCHALLDPDHTLRGEAAHLLGEMNYQQAIEPLRLALEDVDPFVREDVACALGKLGDATALPALLACLKQGQRDHSGRRNIVEYALRPLQALKALGDPSASAAILDLIVQHLSSRAQWNDMMLDYEMVDEWHTRMWNPANIEEEFRDFTACLQEVFLALCDEKTFQRTLAIIHDPSYDAFLRGYLVNLLGALERPEAAEALLEAAHFHPDVVSQYRALRTLAQRKDLRALDCLLEALSESNLSRLANVSSSNDLRDVYLPPIIHALADMGEQRAVEPLLALLLALPLNQDVINALARLGDRRAVEPLLAIVQKKYAARQEEAITALGKLGDRRAVEPLLAIVERGYYKGTREMDPYVFGRLLRAITALGLLGDRRAMEPLLTIIQNTGNMLTPDRHAVMLPSAITALGQLGDLRAVVPLIERLQWLFCFVIAGLLTFYQRRSVMEMFEAISTALVYLGDPRALEPLREIQIFWEERIKRNDVFGLDKSSPTQLVKMLQEAVNRLEQKR